MHHNCSNVSFHKFFSPFLCVSPSPYILQEYRGKKPKGKVQRSAAFVDVSNVSRGGFILIASSIRDLKEDEVGSD